MTSYETPNLNAALPTGMRLGGADAAARRATSVNLYGEFDYAITRDQTLRVAFYQNDNTADNLGVGALRSARARLLDRGHVRHLPDPGSRAARPPLLHQHAALNVNVVHSEQHAGARGADDPRQRRVHERRRADRGRPRLDARQPRSRISTTCAASTRCAPASSSTAARTAPTTRRTISAPTPSRASTAFEAGQPRSYTRRIGDPTIDY